MSESVHSARRENVVAAGIDVAATDFDAAATGFDAAAADAAAVGAAANDVAAISISIGAAVALAADVAATLDGELRHENLNACCDGLDAESTGTGVPDSDEIRQS